MSWRKSKFSYFMWFLYTLFTVAVLMLATEAQTEKIFGKILFGGLISGFGIAVLTGLAVYLKQWSLERRRNNAKMYPALSENNAQNSARHRVTWEIVVVVVLLAAGLILRLDRMPEGKGDLSAYYETAMVMEGQVIPSVVHGVDYLYLQVLHLFFLFVGNKFVAAVWLQIILQLLAAFMLFVGVRRLAGPAASLVTFGIFMFAGAMIDGAVILSPQMLYLLLLTIGIDFLTECRKNNRINYLAVLGVGLWIGMMGYLDIGGFLLLILLASCAEGGRNEETDRKSKQVAFFFGLSGTLAGFFGIIGVFSHISGKAFGIVLDDWMKLYSPGEFQSLALHNDLNMGWWTVVLTVFLIAGVFSFWYDKQRDRMSMCVLGGCVSVLAGCFGMFTEELPMYLYLFLFLVVLAGMGVGEIYNEPMKNESEDMEAEVTEESQMVKKEKKVKRGKKDTRGIEAAAAQVQEVQAEPAEKTDAKEQGDMEAAMSEEKGKSIDEPAISEVEGENVDKPAMSEEKGKNIDEPAVEETKSPKYIENPLPLPKPHVKRIMDYARKPNPGEDDFDHSVNDDDDFDI